MPDQYANYAQLKNFERENKDYTIFSREGDSQIAVIAPHGGGIEPGTIAIADALAGHNHSFYAFKGLKKSGNGVLHLTSTRFDEALGVRISQRACIVIAIHGSRYRTEAVHIGGRHQRLKREMLIALTAAGFHATINEIPGLGGISPDNICNRCRSGQGVQLEIARGLREKMYENLDHRRLRKKTDRFHTFIDTLKTVLPDAGSPIRD